VAYGDASGNITPGQLTDQFLLDERGREFYFEAQDAPTWFVSGNSQMEIITGHGRVVH